MSKHSKQISLFAAAILSLGLTMPHHAFAGVQPQTRTKQLVEGLYTEDLEAATYFQQGVTQYTRSEFNAADV